MNPLYQEVIDGIHANTWRLIDLENMTGIDRSNVYNYLNGKKKLTFGVVQKFAQVLGWNLKEVLEKPSFIELTPETAQSYIGKELIICTLTNGIATRLAWIKILKIDEKSNDIIFLKKEDTLLEPIQWGEWSEEVYDWLYLWDGQYRIGSSAHPVYIRVYVD